MIIHHSRYLHTLIYYFYGRTTMQCKKLYRDLFLWILCALECNCNGVHCSKEPRVKGGIVDKEALTKVCYTEQLDREVVSSRTASNQNRR